MNYWNELLEWTTGMNYWNELLKRTTGMNYWNELLELPFEVKNFFTVFNKNHLVLELHPALDLSDHVAVQTHLLFN